MPRRKSLSLLLMGVLLVWAAGCCGRNEPMLRDKLQQRQPGNLSFSFQKCDEPGPDCEPHVVSMAWEDVDVLHCVVGICPNCSDGFWAGSYRVEDGHNLVLEYTTLEIDWESACVCPVTLDYHIRHLERRNYSIAIREVDRFHWRP